MRPVSGGGKMKKLFLMGMVFLLLLLSVQFAWPDQDGKSGRGELPPVQEAGETNYEDYKNNNADKGNNQPEAPKQEYADETPAAENPPQATDFPPPPEKAAEPGKNNKDTAGAQKQSSKPEPEESETAAAEKNAQYVLEVFRLTNAEREKAGLEPLRLHEELCDVALLKARDMHDNEYFSHDSPLYGSPLDMVNSFAIPNKGVGENIAGGYRTPEDVVQAWMKSEGHRENILRAEFTSIGIGFYRGTKNYEYYWVQLFLLE